jgi:hypothetical protein
VPADNIIAICEPIVYKMWEPRRLTALWASKACYRATFTFTFSHMEGIQNVNKIIIFRSNHGNETRVEVGSNTSTVNLRVVRGDEMGLKKAAP